MASINTNIPSLTAQHDLARAQKDLTQSLRRLSSGVRINSAADDPAGLIIGELLRSETTAIGRAIANTTRATNIIATTEGALNEVNSLLIDIRDKVLQAASKGALSTQEIDANQLQIDSAVKSIARVANSTAFGGRTLLNGNLDYVYSGIAAASIDGATVYAAQFGVNSNIPVAVTITHAASAALTIFGAAGVGTTGATVQISGTKGSEVLSFVGSTHSSAIAFAINVVKDTTGVSAKMSGTAIRLNSSDVGLAQFVAVETIAGTFATTVRRDVGSDALATVNGAKTDSRGNTLNVNSVNLQARIDLKAGAAAGSTTFYVTGGGALFQIGPKVDFNGQYNIGVQSINPAKLGRAGVGFLNQIVTGGLYSLGTTGGAGTASRILDEAILAVSTQRGRLGALQRNTLETNVNSLNVALENVMAAQSDIRDTDFAMETANMTRAEILVSAGTSVLQTANTIPQSVLALLGR